MSKRSASILVVDDEQEIVRALQRSLNAHGYTVRTAHSDEEALEAVAKWRPDLLVIDLLLPGMSGLEVCRQVRATSNVPIIVLSVKDAQADKVAALDLEADDYVAKPFGMSEVLARVRVALRRMAQAKSGTESCVQVGSLLVNFAQWHVVLRGREVSLTPIEYDLLKVFLTRQMLLSQVWRTSAHASRHSLHVYVAQLRRKSNPTPSSHV